MRWMDFDEPNAEADQLVHVALYVARVARMQRAARDQPIRRRLAIIHDPRIDLGSESNHIWCDVVDEHGAFHAGLIQMLKKSFRILRELNDLLPVRPLLLH